MSRVWGWRAGGSLVAPEQGGGHSAADLEGPPAPSLRVPAVGPRHVAAEPGAVAVGLLLAGGDRLWVPLCTEGKATCKKEQAPSWATSPQMLRSVGADSCLEHRRLCRWVGPASCS